MKKVLLFLVLSFSFGHITAQTEVEKVTSTVSQDKIKGHIYFLADDLLKGRATGTPENKIAASYLANTLRGYGVKPNPETGSYYQQVPLRRTISPQLSFSIDGKSINDIITLFIAETDYNAEFIHLGHGLEEDYAGKDVRGKILLLKGGTPEASDLMSIFQNVMEKKKLAEQAGAVGIIEILNIDNDTWSQVKTSLNSDRFEVILKEKSAVSDTLPYLWIREQDLEQKNLMNVSKEQMAELRIIKQVSDTVVSQNVVGMVEGTDPKLKSEYVIFTAHFDHVGVGEPDDRGDTIYNGARDNAVGTATVLSLAENISQFPTKRSAVFVFFTAEELGLLGSRFYIENPIIPLEQVVYVLNSDNAGYNDTSVATIVGLERTTAAPLIKKAVKTFDIIPIDDPVPDQDLFNRSDNVVFARKGIPAPTFFMGFRSFDGDVTKYYHKPGDEAHTLDYDYLLKFFRAYVLAGRLIANDPETPFWTPGDEYEEAGKALYGIKE